MNARDIDDIPKLCEWVKEHIRSDQDFLVFTNCMREITQSMLNTCPDPMVRLELTSGEVVIQGGERRIAYIVTFKLEAMNLEWVLAILVDEVSGKMCDPQIVPANVPSSLGRQMQ